MVRIVLTSSAVTMLLGLCACEGPSSGLAEGATCVRTSQCARGLACVRGRCSSDLGPLAEAGVLPPIDTGMRDAVDRDGEPDADPDAETDGAPDDVPAVDARPGTDAAADSPSDVARPDAGRDGGPMDAGSEDADMGGEDAATEDPGSSDPDGG
ncbi:MAG: hypothetical protein NZ898_12865 [Myxococcota bacterium]|nr:hypothetical protein [Myxococcota bacterium]MDW8362827.1 hypothetical protein [Myxococcales bacterium]